MEVGQLVVRAASGERAAWEALVSRFEGLVWSIARGHRLGDADAADVFQTTWMRLVEHVDELRNPDAVGAWLATTARNECLRVLRHQARQVPTDDELADEAEAVELDARLLTEERDAALWRAFATLDRRCRELLRLLAADPPPSYELVGATLGMPIGSIGPTRGRCLARLRRAAAGARITSDGAPS